MTQTTTSSPTSSTSARKSSKGGKSHNKRWLILQPLLFEPVNTYLLTERGNLNYQSVLVREYYTPKLHKRMLVGRYVGMMWAWDDNHNCWVRLKAILPLCPAMKLKSRPPYPQVCVGRRINGKIIIENIKCHRLMAAVWCPNPDPEHRTQVDHLNGDINDYSQFNLEWVTPEENIRRAVAMRRARKKQLTN